MTTLAPGVEGGEAAGPRIPGSIFWRSWVSAASELFKARQLRLDRFVALKMIRIGAGASRLRPRPL